MRRSLLAMIAILSIPMGFAQSSSSASQILRGMSDSQRQALIKEFAGDVVGSGVEGDSTQAARNEGSSSTNRRRADREGGRDQDAERDVVRPLSQLLIEIDFIRDRPARVEAVAGLTAPIMIPEEKAPEYSPQERVRFQELIDLIKARNPYVLDAEGQLTLPGFAPIPLAGLSSEEVVRRLVADPRFAKLSLRVAILPVKPVGVAALKPFGYDQFETDSPATFAPVSGLPVPSDYLVGPDDQFVIQLFGAQDRTLRIKVDRSGELKLPEIGPLAVTGKTFSQVAAEIESRVSAQMIGTRAAVSLGDARSVQVLVLGEARFPGSYTVSSLATMVTALYASGGVKSTGSLRSIQLRRQGRLVRELDLYDLLLRGDTSGDLRVQSGDVVFIPTVGSTVAVYGAVRRPAVYELRGSATLSQLLQLAGGIAPDGDVNRVTLLQGGAGYGEEKSVVSLAAGSDAARQLRIQPGSELVVPRMPKIIDRGVSVQGHVVRPGVTAWRDGIRISEILSKPDDLLPNADSHYVLIRREHPETRRIEILSVDLQAAWASAGGPADLQLASRDSLFVFDAFATRRPLLDPLLEELRRQASLGDPAPIVTIGGRVHAPGDCPLEAGMRVSDLIRAGGRITDQAFPDKAELTRYRSNGRERINELLEVDLAAILRGDVTADVELQPYDVLVIKELPEWAKREVVMLRGEVRFPGEYPIRRGETLRSLLERAGGLTALAYPRGSVFTRLELRQREELRNRELAERIQRDLAATSVQALQASQKAENATAATAAQALLAQLQTTAAVGRLVINLDNVIAGGVGSRGDIILRDGDVLTIPKIPQEVTVLGEVQNSTSHLFRSGLSVRDYIDLSGGLSQRADGGRLYVIRADGSVVTPRSSWLGMSRATLVIQPGDTIVAPMDVERLPPLPLWQAITSIVYNAAVALAAINSL